MKNLLENIVNNITYENLGAWCMPNLSSFSASKNLYEYQARALRNIIKVLSLYYKSELFQEYKQIGLKLQDIDIKKYESKKDWEKSKSNKRFEFFEDHNYLVSDSDREQKISGEIFLNRACFWMATGSGKSLLIIKTIVLLDYLQKQELIKSDNALLLLFSRDDLIDQFKKLVIEYNYKKEKTIEMINLKDYESMQNNLKLDNTIKVYYSRGDLLKDKRKNNELDYRSYINHGKWYILLDEAHKGEDAKSLMKNYLAILSKDGFLFNFSATFTDEIDYLTTCYNFNLEKFISAGYGKNLYLSNSYFSFQKETKDDFLEREKQKQVLKSFVVFALVKKQKKENLYHFPLLVTLCNSVNNQDSDMKMFFQKIEEIALAKIDKDLLAEVKEELIAEFSENKKYVFGKDTLEYNRKNLESINIKDILFNIF